jgi:hypothetical protein
MVKPSTEVSFSSEETSSLVESLISLKALIKIKSQLESAFILVLRLDEFCEGALGQILCSAEPDLTLLSPIQDAIKKCIGIVESV